MKVLLLYSMGKDSVLMLGAMLEDPKITDICLIHHAPAKEKLDDIQSQFIEQVYTSLLKHDKIHHIFSISFLEFKQGNKINEHVNPEEYYLMSAENDGPLMDEFLTRLCFKNNYKGILNYQYSHDEFIRLYNKYITKTLIHSGHYLNEAVKSKVLLENVIGRVYNNSDVLAIFNKDNILKEMVQTIVIESSLYKEMSPFTFTDDMVKYICSISPIFSYNSQVAGLEESKKIEFEKIFNQ